MFQVGFIKINFILSLNFMNDNLKKIIDKPITVTSKFIVDGYSKDDYIQGILIAVENDILIIQQHIPFCNLFFEGEETISVERKIHIQNINSDGIKNF